MPKSRPKLKLFPLRELPEWPNHSLTLKCGERIYRSGSTKEYIVLGEVAIQEAPPDPIDGARDPYG